MITTRVELFTVENTRFNWTPTHRQFRALLVTMLMDDQLECATVAGVHGVTIPTARALAQQGIPYHPRDSMPGYLESAIDNFCRRKVEDAMQAAQIRAHPELLTQTLQ